MTLRIYDGGELCKKELKEFYKKCGITWKNTTPQTPWHNGATKRMNRMLTEKERTLLSCNSPGKKSM